MNLEDSVRHCLSKQGAEESCPFGPEVLVYKVVGKMFALAIPDEVPARLNLKVDPEYSLELQDEYEAIRPGYHMNKRHWITLHFDGSVPSRLIRHLIDQSYDLVVASLPKSKRRLLESLEINPDDTVRRD